MNTEPAAATIRLLEPFGRRMVADGRAVVGAGGRLVYRDLTDEEIASGRYPLAGREPNDHARRGSADGRRETT